MGLGDWQNFSTSTEVFWISTKEENLQLANAAIPLSTTKYPQSSSSSLHLHSFIPEFGLLPLQYRIEVEQRYLYEVLRNRQKAQSANVGVKMAKVQKLQPPIDAILKHVDQLLQLRRHKTDVPPSEYRMNQYIIAATKKTRTEMSRKIRERETSENTTLSFEEQWYRRQDYGINFEIIS